MNFISITSEKQDAPSPWNKSYEFFKKRLRFAGILFLALFAISCSEEDEDVIVVSQNGLVAVAGDDQQSLTQAVVTLDGSSSFDKYGKPFEYQWSVRIAPSGSTAALEHANEAQATFTPDLPGVYVIQLKTIQGKWESKDEVIVRATSPNGEDPATVVLPNTILTDMVLENIVEDPSQPDYIASSNIAVRANLVIRPGTVIAFGENQGMEIMNGSISAIGTAEAPIVFKGLGGRPAYWKGIAVYTNSDANRFSHVTVTEGGSLVCSESNARAGLTLVGTSYSGAAATIDHSVFSDNGGFGLIVQGMSTVVELSANTFTNNAASAAYVHANSLLNIGEQTAFTMNGFDGIETGGMVTNGPATWAKRSSHSYLVTSDIGIYTPVTVGEGSTFLMKKDVAIRVLEAGSLNATGSSAARIIFTAQSASQPWDGIYFNTQGDNRLVFAEVSHAGSRILNDAAQPANIALGNGGQLHIENTQLRHGKGYGLVAKYVYQVNENIFAANTYEQLLKGYLLPRNLMFPDRPPLAGDWMSQWSLMNGREQVANDYYDRASGAWFDGANDPWTMAAGKGMGVHIDEDGSFYWAIGEHSPMTGCPSYSAEFITGEIRFKEETITFAQDFWRSKFVMECDPEQNVDMEIEPSDIVLKYEYDKLYNMMTGEVVWKLTLFNPDGSSFALYRK